MVYDRLDFTLYKYEGLCQSAIKSGYQIRTVSSYLHETEDNTSGNRNLLIIRHDVDRLIEKAFRMASMEHSQGIRTTYYFRKSGFKHRDTIKAISDMGHEIGYHYEVLDKARGDVEIAIKLFKDELAELRSITNVETVCMHGNPFTKWLNRDIWKNFDFHDLGLIGEAYLSPKNVYYLSDTGRIWNSSRKVKDKMSLSLPEQNLQNINVTSTDDVIRLIKETGYSRIYLTIHPERWSHNLLTWVLDEIRDATFNSGKVVLHLVRKRI